VFNNYKVKSKALT